ncbi:hypothetical protein ALC56_14437 [Trachymyrmex septentrionalis]|uniref:DNA-directed DNA polymerase n=1 Tax=Trachymyrmex septentrionalis TaxID=34720 RepID=A0A195ETS2_9HYME|nr:hypothetical protein ALC56_14437 [Trachymyrmex septentrionalis]
MRLSELPKAFGLRDTLGKDFFPHLFNVLQNQNYIGPISDARYYSPEQMKPEEHERFMVWHEKMLRLNFVFDFKQETRGDVCPFIKCMTIASTCMKVFRKNFLREEEIGIIPPGGYRYKDNHSHKALYRISERDVTIHYMLQFHGCFWHGCSNCYQINRERKLTSGTSREDTIDTRYERTFAMTENHPMLINPPLHPRETFFGGRTENIVTQYEVTSTEKIRYVDICSLVLPYRIQGKLFGLCRAWVSYELRKALEKSYLVTSVSEIFFKLKQEASGWSSKWMMRVRNSTFGNTKKLRGFVFNRIISSNLPNIKIVKKYECLATLLTSSEHEITNILPVNDEIIYVSWRLREETVASSPQTNSVIAAWTTSQARLILYEYLEKLGSRVLYCNTDSCIYINRSKSSEYESWNFTGNFLGDDVYADNETTNDDVFHDLKHPIYPPPLHFISNIDIIAKNFEISSKHNHTMKSIEEILKSASKSYCKHTHLLMKHLFRKTVPDKISWDEHGIVTIDGNVVKDSNITDLINNATHSGNFSIQFKNQKHDIIRNIEAWRKNIVTEKTNQSEDKQATDEEKKDLSKFESSTDRDKANTSVSQTSSIFESSTSHTPAKEVHFEFTQTFPLSRSPTTRNEFARSFKHITSSSCTTCGGYPAD